jgi:hypothetical protein
VAAIGGEVRGEVAFIVSATLRLAEARDEGVDIPNGGIRLVADRAQGSAGGPREGQYRRIVWRYAGGVRGDATVGILKWSPAKACTRGPFSWAVPSDARVLPTNAASGEANV